MGFEIFSKLSILKDKHIKFLLISTFLTTLSASIISPIRSIYITNFNVSLIQLGILFTVSTIVKLFIDSPMGTLCDHISRKKIFVVSCALSILLLFFQTISTSFEHFFIVFLLEGFVTAAYNISLWSYMNDVLKKTKINYSIISVFWMIAGIIGPYLGGYIGSFGNTYSFYAGMICEFVGLFFAFKIPHIKKKEGTLKDGLKEAFKGVYVDEYKSFMKSNNNVKISTFFDAVLVYDGSIFYSFVPIFLNSYFGLGEVWIGAFFSVLEITALLVRLLESAFFKKIIKKNLIILSSAVTGICYLLIPFTKSLPVFVALSLISSFSSYMIYPLTYQIFMNSLNHKKQGEITGMREVISDVGGTIGNFVGGLVSSMSSIPMAVFSSGVLYLTGSGLAGFIKRSKKRQAEVNLIMSGKKLD